MVPPGTFWVGSLTFQGPCKGPIALTLRGKLMAPPNHLDMKGSEWISFRYITGLVVNGGGSLHGQGAYSWKYQHNSNKPLPIVSISIFKTSLTHNHHFLISFLYCRL